MKPRMGNMNQHEQIHFDDLSPEAVPVQLELELFPAQLLKSHFGSMTFFMQTLNLMLERRLTSKLAPSPHACHPTQ
jgi:hypothetical protein